MTTKTYRKQGTVLRSWSLPIELEKGSSTRVEFSGGGITAIQLNCSYSTNDKTIQKALEKHKLFNDPDGFVLVKYDNDTKQYDDENATAVPEVKDFNSAKEYILKNNKGYTQADVSTPEKVRGIAENLGIAFPNWIN
jgi:hypothetical protein